MARDSILRKSAGIPIPAALLDCGGRVRHERPALRLFSEVGRHRFHAAPPPLLSPTASPQSGVAPATSLPNHFPQSGVAAPPSLCHRSPNSLTIDRPPTAWRKETMPRFLLLTLLFGLPPLHADPEKLPKVLLLGDSISIGYTPTSRDSSGRARLLASTSGQVARPIGWMHRLGTTLPTQRVS